MEQFGDREVVDGIYEEFASSFPKLADDAKAQALAGDWEKLDRTAHTIKGNAMVVGFSEAADAAIALRQAAKLSDSAGAVAFAEQLEKMKEDL